LGIEEIDEDEENIPIWAKIGKRHAWILLLFSILNSALIPTWIMNIPADKYLRITWRFFM